MQEMPDYNKPPVVEVAMGIQFAPLTALTTGHVGLFWAGVREQFPNVEDRAPILHWVETAALQGAEAQVRLLERPELSRTWFIDSTGTRIIQVQRDRFLHNWRKVGTSDLYPRYETVRDNFMRYWGQFRHFLDGVGLHPDPDQCEITYVNLVPKGEGWETTADLGELFRAFAWKPRSEFLPEPEQMRCSVMFPFPDGMGRLYVDLAPVRRPPDDALALRFSLTAHGRPDENV